MDSTVLLFNFIELRRQNPCIKLRAIHINYNLHIRSSLAEKYCVKICNRHNIILILKKIKKNIINVNIEEQARKIRIQETKKELLENEVVVTAHHLNDKCETFLLALKRGSGPLGLGGMNERIKFGKSKLIRPFIRETKKSIKNWAIKNKLVWIEDDSNNNTYYERNFLRKKIIPILENRWPFFLKNCYRSSFLCFETNRVLNSILQGILKKNVSLNNSLKISFLLKLDHFLRNCVIRKWISLSGKKMISLEIIEKISKELIFSKKDANPKIVVKDFEFRRYKNFIHLVPKLDSISQLILMWNDFNSPLKLPKGLGFVVRNNLGTNLPFPNKYDLVNIRFKVEGSLSISGRNKSRKVKKIFQELSIPPWYREKIPLLYYNNTMIAALGLFVVTNNKYFYKKEKWTIAWINKCL